ncbi:hypothetical protein C0995_015342 [Termitomyces sp. Mi166|nr:hypothetical protein C0995_015342 [Termitomyces sp. Mi166\
MDLENAPLPVNSKRTPVRLRGLPLFILSFQTLGIIYSDIGTSPLYVLNGLWPASGPPPPKEDVIGGISAILWSLILLPLLKYIVTSLHFGTNEGEGGTFALYQGLYPPADKDHNADRTLTGSTQSLSEKTGKRRINDVFRSPLRVWCLFGTAYVRPILRSASSHSPMHTRLTMSDGVFTPAVSVTSAVGGIAVAKPSVTKDIIPISIRFGTSRIAFLFAPRFVFPSLALAYLGQGARLVHDGDVVITNVFYQSIPGPHNGALFWIVYVFAILATIIASQAMITATFSLVQQLVNSRSFPPVRMVHTSDVFQGQIYTPTVNWVLMIATIVIVAIFSNLTNLTNAYGFAVTTVMFSTTILIAIQIYYVKQRPLVLALCYFIGFGFLDGGLFWVASYKKVPHGAWVPLMMGLILLIIMWSWTWAKALEDNFDGANRQNLRHFIHQGPKEFSARGDPEIEIEEKDIEIESTVYYYLPGIRENSALGKVMDLERRVIQRIPTCAVFHKVAEGKGVPHTFIVCVVAVARVSEKERYDVSKVRTVEGFYGVTYYIGFRDDFDVNIRALVDKICDLEKLADPKGSAPLIQEIRAISQTATHIVPRYHVVSRKVNAGIASVIVNRMRRYLIEEVYRNLAIMFPETSNWLTSEDEIIRIGITAVI